MVTIGYNITAETARQESIVHSAASAEYWEDHFAHAIDADEMDVEVERLHGVTEDYISYDISHKTTAKGDAVVHSIVYEFRANGPFKKKQMKAFIYTKLDALFEAKGFNKQQ